MTTYKINEPLNGIELYFDNKPDAEILETLKANKWRWNNAKKCWYTRQSEMALNMVSSIIGGTLDTAEGVEPVRKEIKNAHGVEVGQIYYTSWGYEQTNIYFYQVVAITEKMATVREISQIKDYDTSSMSGHCIPVKDSFIKNAKEQRTQTDNNWNGTMPMLKNADGNKNLGSLYTDGDKLYFSEYY